MKKNIILFIISICYSAMASAQVGDYRNVWSLGASGGVAMNKVSFMPDVSQTMHQGSTFGIAARYTSEKYFSTICSIQFECNIAQLGWKEDIKTLNGDGVRNPETTEYEAYERDMTYVQIPILAHLAWGKERRGFNFFINGGPQFGLKIKEQTTKNYNLPFVEGNFPDFTGGLPRANAVVAQETMEVKNNFDYGIALGAGIECDIKHVGRFSLEGRYYYGLGDMFGNAKTDEFGKSANGTVYVKMSYMHNL